MTSWPQLVEVGLGEGWRGSKRFKDVLRLINPYPRHAHGHGNSLLEVADSIILTFGGLSLEPL